MFVVPLQYTDVETLDVQIVQLRHSHSVEDIAEGSVGDAATVDQTADNRSRWRRLLRASRNFLRSDEHQSSGQPATSATDEAPPPYAPMGHPGMQQLGRSKRRNDLGYRARRRYFGEEY